MAKTREHEGHGSFLLGLAAGLVGGLLVLALVWRRGKRLTRQGLYFGAAINLILLLGTCR